jgi:acyl-[acyl carrier protein]--UDP-N-acetylglucosamine O-acyltransferase
MLSLVELDWFKCNHNGRRKNRKKCNIFPGAVISAVPQDLKFGGEDSLAIIGDNCTIRECVSIGNNCLWQTTLGKIA